MDGNRKHRFFKPKQIKIVVTFKTNINKNNMLQHFMTIAVDKKNDFTHYITQL